MNDAAITLESARHRYNNLFAPWIQDLNISIEKISTDEVVMHMPYNDKLCRVGGIVCGQSLMALIDTCMVYVCFTGLQRYSDCATVNQNTSFLRPVIGKDVIATGRVIKAGRTLVFGEVTLSAKGDNKPVCTAALTYAVLPEKK